jgi:DNA polymerase III sliding clamp (beta) subunit (PCNA family)
MERAELTAVLKKLSPALSGKDLIPIFSCFCFGDTTTYAYDDVVALIHPKPTGDLRGGIRGSLLLNMLQASKAKEVTITQEGEKAQIQLGRTKLDVPVLEVDAFLFKPPTTGDAASVKVDEAFLTALEKAAVSIGRDPSHPWRLGVTIMFGKGWTTFYASDNKTAAKVQLGKAGEDEPTVAVLPPRFVELLMEIGKSDPPLKIHLSKEWVQASFTTGLKLFSRTISGADLDIFQGLFADKVEGAVEIPKGLDRCLERAALVAPYAKDPFTSISIDAERIRFKTKSPAGDVADAILLEGHEAVEVDVTPDLLQRGLKYAAKIKVLPEKVVLRGPGYTYLSSTVSRGDSAPAEE